MADKPQHNPTDPQSQRKALEDAERHANAKQPRNFKDDAMQDKQVRVEPDGTGPTSTGSFDADEDQARGSGNDTPDADRGKTTADENAPAKKSSR